MLTSRHVSEHWLTQADSWRCWRAQGSEGHDRVHLAGSSSDWHKSRRLHERHRSWWKHHNAYDVNGRFAGVVNAFGRAATYAYDVVGNVTSISNAAAAVTLLGVSRNSATRATVYGIGFSSTPSQNRELVADS